jgi:MHS family proline/betaine transporter-like MFS transporter
MIIKRKTILAPVVGTVLEYYDFALYGAFAPLISNYFFNTTNKDNLALLVYFVTFLMRPIGAIIFGHIGDLYGRRIAFGLPLMITAFCTLGIALIPSYNEIGILSSVLLIICRLGQGLCIGAEFGGALVFTSEHHSKNLGIVSGIIGFAVILGSLFANFISYILTLNIFPESFWRVPFIIGSLIGVIGVWIRWNIDETPEFVKERKMNIPFFEVIKNYRISVFKSAIYSGLNGLMGSFTFVYINFLLVNNLKWQINESLLVISLAHVVALVSTLMSGRLSQRHGPEKIIKICGFYLLIVMAPCMFFIKNNIVMIPILFLALGTGVYWGSVNMLQYKLFPSQLRYTGVSFGDSIGRIIFSAPVPFLCNILLINFGFVSVIIVPVVVIIISLIILIYSLSKFKP